MKGKAINVQQLMRGLFDLKQNALFTIHKLMVENKINEIDLKPSHISVAGQVGNRAISERWELTTLRSNAYGHELCFTAEKNGLRTTSVFLDCYDLQFILEYVQMVVNMHKDCESVK